MNESERSTASPVGSNLLPNILLIVLDCARAKSFSLSGGEEVARTPVIDALARRGTSFPRAVAPSNWTLPSHTSLFTGKYPCEHGIRTYQSLGQLPETTAECLRTSGYDTCMLTENIQLVGGFGLERGFDFVDFNRREKGLSNIFGVKRSRTSLVYSPAFVRMLSRIPPLIAPLSWITHLQETSFKREVCSDGILEWFHRWLLSRSGDRPFFAFLNFLDTHNPYNLTSRSSELSLLDRAYLYTPRSHLLLVPGLQSHVRWKEMVAGYLTSITEADEKVGRLLSIVRDRGVLDRTMVIVTSDHGQAFGEMGNVYHGTGATDSVTRVPLVVSAPDHLTLPHRVDRWVSLCEIDSWIRSVARGYHPFDEDGRPLGLDSPVPSRPEVVYCEGPPVSDANRSMAGCGSNLFWSHRLLAAYRNEEKFVLDVDTGEVLRWNVARDPDLNPAERLVGESARTIRTEVFQPYEVADVSRLARSTYQPPAVNVEIDRRLRSWGYD